MSLKDIIKRKQLLKQIAANEFVLPGEPMIYSVKYSIGERKRPVLSLKRQQWASFLRCTFPNYTRAKQAVVLLVRFYVSPNQYAKVKPGQYENKPAPHSFELCDYILALLEMLRHVLFNSYRQIVKIDAEKYYSDNPRTVMQYMRWEDYIDLQNHRTIEAATEDKRETSERESVQPKSQRDAANQGDHSGAS